MVKKDEIIFATRYNPVKSNGLCCSGESKTDQSFKDECDVNKIMEKYKTIENYNALMALRNPGRAKPQFGDFANLPDFAAAQNTIVQAQTMFEALPSNIRDRFANDPGEFLAFMSDEKNKDEAIRLGLCEADPVQAAEKDLSTSSPVNGDPIVDKSGAQGSWGEVLS